MDINQVITEYVNDPKMQGLAGFLVTEIGMRLWPSSKAWSWPHVVRRSLRSFANNLLKFVEVLSAVCDAMDKVLPQNLKEPELK